MYPFKPFHLPALKSFKKPFPFSLASFSANRLFKHHDIRVSMLAAVALVLSLLMMKAQANSAYYTALNDKALYGRAHEILLEANEVTQHGAQLQHALQSGETEGFSEELSSQAGAVLTMANPSLAEHLGLSQDEASAAELEAVSLMEDGEPMEPAEEEPSLSELFKKALDAKQQTLLLEESGSFKAKFIAFANPITRLSISSRYGMRHGRSHMGTDFQAPIGTPIQAAASGRVISAGFSGAYGNLIIIDHGNGITSRYAHCSSILVRVGQAITRGALIGKVGTTGRSTGPHLHFELMANGSHMNPERYLPSSGHRTVVARQGFRKISEL